MSANKSEINGNKPRNNSIERAAVVLIEWMNKIIMARPRKIAAIIAHDAIPFVDDEKSHWHSALAYLDRQSVQEQLVFLGYILGKHVSVLLFWEDIHCVNKPIVV